MPSKFIDRNTYVIKWSETHSCYVAACIEFPGLAAAKADTAERALKGIQKAAQDALSDQDQTRSRAAREKSAKK